MLLVLTLEKKTFLFVAAGCVVGVSVFIRLANMQTPDAMVAECYRQARTLEFRLPNVDPVSTELAPTDEVRRRRSLRLLHAINTVNAHLERRPTDLAWIEAHIALDLLVGDLESAMKFVDRALDSWPDRSTLLLYQAITYAEKARAMRREDLFAPAYANFTRLVKYAPELRAIALFNRAILAEKIFLFQGADRDWRRYLEMDQASRWSEEAQRRQDALSRRISVPRETANDAKEFWASLRSEEQDQYPVERAIDTAITEWLPKRSTKGAPDAPLSQMALQHLAEVLLKSHGDPWLRDLIKPPHTRDWKEAMSSLARATALNLSGERNAADRESQRAIEGFERAGNTAGSLYAHVEKLYALNRSLTVSACLEAAKGLEPLLDRNRYIFPLTRYLIEISGCQSRGNFLTDAERNLKRALIIARKAGYPALELRALSILANHHNVSGNSTEAWNDCWAGLNRFWSGRYGAVRGHTLYFNFSLTAERLGFLEFALALEQEAANFAGQTPNHLQAAEGYFREGLLASRVGDDAATAQALAAGNQALSQLPDDDVRRRYEWLLEKALAEVNLKAGNISTVLTSLQPFGPKLLQSEQAHERVDYYRLRALTSAAMGDRLAQYRFLSLATDETERGFNRLLREEDRIRWRVQAGSVFRPLVVLTLSQPKGIRRALDLWEWYLDRSKDSIASASTWRNPEPLPLAALNSATLISFLWLPDHVGVWVADDRGTAFGWAPGPAPKLAVLCRRFVQECSDADVQESEVRRTGRELYDQLFGALKEGLSGRRLLVETDGDLGAIPFEALVEPGGQYLAQSHSIVYSSGLHRWESLRNTPGVSVNAEALIVASPSVKGKLARQFPPLPDALSEGTMASRTFARAIVLTGPDGTLPAIRAHLGRAEMFHFAGHGLSNSEDGALLLAPADPDDEGSLLTTAELSGQNLKYCRLAVLSACSSGAGESRGPVNPNSLVNGFLRAGVRDVVASRWRVDSASTSALMRHFYDRLRSMNDVSAVLQYAALQIRSKPGMSHPYYWAAFSTFGE